MGEKTKIEWLKWFLIFMNSDLDSIKARTRLSLRNDIAMIVNGMGYFLFEQGAGQTTIPVERFDIKEPIENLYLRIESNMQEYQEFLMKFFDGLTKNIKAIYEMDNGRDIPLSELVSPFDLMNIESSIHMKIRTSNIKYTNVKVEQKKHTAQIAREDISRSSFYISYTASSHEETLLFYLCRALEGITLGSIKTCKECGNWFLQTSKREKLFCETRCAMKSANKSRRKRIKEDSEKGISNKYEEELRAGTKRARKSYEKKMKKKNPNVRIERRPRKHKQ